MENYYSRLFCTIQSISASPLILSFRHPPHCWHQRRGALELDQQQGEVGQQQPPQPDDCKLLHHFAAWPWDLGDLKDLSIREGKVHQTTWPPSVRCWHPLLCLVYPTLGCDLARAVNRYLFFLAQHSYPDVTAHLHIVSS